jgi:hypothetical protein
VGKLALNDCLQTQVFRKVVEIYQANPILRRTIKPKSWFVWDGRVDMKEDPFVHGNLPAIRLTPAAQPVRPLTNVRFESMFLIRQEIGIPGLNMDDIMNLWYAIHVSVFTGDGSRAALQALQTLPQSATVAGQNVISLGLGSPMFTPHADAVGSEMLVADGDIWVNIMVPR